MNELNTVILGQTIPTYNLLIGLGVLSSIAWAVYRHQSIARHKIVDNAIAGLIGAIAIARLFHVWLNWDYFVNHRDEIFTLSQGGLNWHGAVIGALLGMWIMTKLTRIDYLHVLEISAFALPLLGYLSWRACQVNRCYYGAEVSNLSDYPPLIVAELPDIFGLILPRFNTQLIGMGVSLVVLGLLIILRSKRWLIGHHFAIILLIYSSFMFLTGFLRGDTVTIVFNMRLDQWLDVAFILISIGLIAGKLVFHAQHSKGVGQT